MRPTSRPCPAARATRTQTIEQLEETIAAFDGRIEAALAPFREVIERQMEVPGLSETSAQILLAEIGCYQDLGAAYFTRRDHGRLVAKLASRIRSLSYDVAVKVAEVAA